MAHAYKASDFILKPIPVLDKLVAAGIRGIINFAPVVLEVPETVMTSNVFVVDELRSMAAKLSCLVD